ncbi:MAG: SAM-dependent chlorinase/fluorinase [Nitrospina sp.]|jgi:S-adenosyl-L-methionine hydrolase (adenosine-forming)|nr:SAM-dependent chlorinase/fluorinase [Nitrospina sp.]MBT3509813.1 SAM-dependent chlorinase/fluorinase [Nitrospina sp.]MBT3876211.1 SAM-dependent chlorinase/fluorinase [Nitrospina sp.]MBT4049811.1 SAM-dependent chlorinase/fluorinase [Nitrospina sp.]MBT4558707.1 SAM-dependent chlorinase/fluorinase [Nitrospina sp.]
MRPVITLTTDFGLDDPFVGIMKGVILNIAPDAQIVDITHNVEPQNIAQAALILNATYPWFPRKTVHVVVVDPGVGGTAKTSSKKKGGPGPVIRRAMVVQSKFQTFIGPDNGVLTSALYSDSKAYEITSKKYILENVSNTFHGRDVFAPCAGWIASGITHSKMGPRVLKPVLMDFPQPQLKGATLQGEIIYSDRFGNLTTNISAELINETFLSSDTIKIQVGKQRIEGFVTGYYQMKSGQPGAIINSWNQLEIFYREDSAQKKLKARVGQSVSLKAN